MQVARAIVKVKKNAFYYELILIAYILRADEYYTFYLDHDRKCSQQYIIQILAPAP